MVVNPQSQNGSLGRKWAQLSQCIRRELGSFDDVRTRAPGDATKLTRQALLEGADIVVAIGGDGTINEVANGFYEDGKPVSSNGCMAILPFGTGGDFRRTLNLPNDIQKAAQIIARGNTKKIDLGKLEFTTPEGGTGERLFINIASFGISGEVSDEANNSSKRLGGRLTFMLATLKVGMKFHSKRVRVVFDADESKALETNINTVAIANGRYFGGGMKIAPNAEVSDGKFDVVSLGDIPFRKSLLQGHHLYAGTHLKLDKVSSRRAQSVHAESIDGQRVWIDMDGEVPGVLPATFTIMPEALQMVVP
jgi:YegS/Rv2252/BmrU family lipid kinase